MPTTEHNNRPHLESLAICLSRMILEGYTEDFTLNENGLISETKQSPYSAAQISAINSYRFEGPLTQQENAILYIIETSDGTKGTLLDANGNCVKTLVDRFLQDIENLKPKAIKN